MWQILTANKSEQEREPVEPLSDWPVETRPAKQSCSVSLISKVLWNQFSWRILISYADFLYTGNPSFLIFMLFSSSTMAKQAFITSNCKALNFMYKVPAREFSESRTGQNKSLKRHYKVDLAVDKHPEYPALPPSVWTATLTIRDSNGHTSASVELNGDPESLKSPGLVLADWKISSVSMEHVNDKKDFKSSDFYGHIGPAGFENGKSLEGLPTIVMRMGTRPVDGGPAKSRYCLAKHSLAYAFISLMFMMEKPTTCRVLETLYESSLLADCKLVCGAREFPAHRAILAAQSPVFAAMFQTEMKEKSSGICTITDTHPDVLDALLQFAYTGELSKADGKLEGLWTAADKYDMQDLKKECERLMLGSVSDDNAFEYLCFAKQRGLKRLKVEAAKIIAQEPVCDG